MQKGPWSSEARRDNRLPVSSSGHKHFVKGELPMQVLLDDVDPFGIPRLIIQLLTEHTEEILGFRPLRGVNGGRKMTPGRFQVPRNRKEREEIKRNRERHLTDLKLSLVLLSLDLPTRQIEPRASSQGRRNPLLAPQPHLEQSCSKFRGWPGGGGVHQAGTGDTGHDGTNANLCGILSCQFSDVAVSLELLPQRTTGPLTFHR